MLLALDAELLLQRGTDLRTIPLREFFLAYRKTALAPSEFIREILIPREALPDNFRAWKVSKRADDDISIVFGAFSLHIEQGSIVQARVAFGGMDAIPRRAERCERALLHQPWNRETVMAASQVLVQDFTPLSDARASADYRMQLARNLLLRYFFCIQGEDVAMHTMSHDNVSHNPSSPAPTQTALQAQFSQPLPGGVWHSHIHESATLHVSGEARYIDDRPEPEGLLHLCPRLSDHAHARILKIDVEPCYRIPGVVAVLTRQHIPGNPDIGVLAPGDLLLADSEVNYAGQMVLVVAAESREAARVGVDADQIRYLFHFDLSQSGGCLAVGVYRWQRAA